MTMMAGMGGGAKEGDQCKRKVDADNNPGRNREDVLCRGGPLHKSKTFTGQV